MLNNGKKLEGLVLYSPANEIVYYKANPNFDKQYLEYEAKVVSELFIGRKIYVKKIWKQKEVFAQEIVKGPNGLYEYLDLYQNKSYFIAANDKIYSLEEDSYLNSLSELYGNKCNWDYNKYYSKLSKDFFKHIVKGYQKDDCFKVNKTLFGVKLMPSVLRNEVFLSDQQLNIDMNSGFKFGIGVQGDFPLYNRTSIYTGVEFFSQEESKEMDLLGLRRVTLDVSHLQFRAGIKFHIDAFFVGFGPVLGNTFSQSTIVLDKFEVGLSEEPIDLSSINFGFDYHIGYYILNKVKRTVQIELKSTRFQGTDLTTNMWSFGVLIGN